ncbi:MAG: glucose-6-phosphate dehydrogenase [Alphaproteobacteria bacterium]
MAARIVPVPPFDLVVFGGTGDLARRKLLPGLYHRQRAGQMPLDSLVLALGRTELGDDEYRAQARAALEAHVGWEELDADAVERFLGCLSYRRIDAGSDEGWAELAAALAPRGDRVRAFYLAVDPRFFSPICERIAAYGLHSAGARLVVEKPLGHDLASARALNRQLAAVFDESDLYRIDHYLGKEAVQNLMALRFANALFEPVWNARHVDHVQITVAERVGVEGRGAYYDRSGAMRDMVQNHLLQLLCLTAMEPPFRFEPDAVRDEKLKVLRALEPIDASNVDRRAVRGQYRARDGMSGYGEDVGDAGSTTESFVALKAGIANWRWSGTPFYLRTGKRLQARLSEIAVVFKEAPHSIFPPQAGAARSNALVIRLQPDEAITLRLTIKDPGPGGMRLIEVPLNMTFASSLGVSGHQLPDAYERLVMDVIRGDQTLFMRSDEVEAAWSWVDPIIEAWAQAGTRPQAYTAGGTGPEDALMLIHRDGRRWREIEA